MTKFESDSCKDFSRNTIMMPNQYRNDSLGFLIEQSYNKKLIDN